ncbi:acylphosphatase [Mariprofundus ferrinatatus]|uniref:Acylphosphatase n=1 Tax=Mariprofundus ferrinatatus TaxID=1921087 RepID=A0A2K8L855_9PROT|nr:acylphosphatase [Mariprofundus ferrinatatus]ATX81114.1 acylphosphatase [Mariprofundus ferrinatatus]
MAEHPVAETCLLARISGRVQGVCFRHYTQVEANRLGLRGWVRNVAEGGVEVCFAGPEVQITMMKRWLQQGPSYASVEHVAYSEATLPESCNSFSIRY